MYYVYIEDQIQMSYASPHQALKAFKGAEATGAQCALTGEDVVLAAGNGYPVIVRDYLESYKKFWAAVEAPEPEKDLAPDLALTKAELLGIAEKSGIVVPPKATKAQILALLAG